MSVNQWLYVQLQTIQSLFYGPQFHYWLEELKEKVDKIVFYVYIYRTTGKGSLQSCGLSPWRIFEEMFYIYQVRSISF